MEFFSIEEMIKLNVGETIVKNYMNLLMKLYEEAMLKYNEIDVIEKNNLLNR